MNDGVLVAVAPNGARLGKADHAALPLSPAEIGRVAAECYSRGAAMIHLHVRDQSGAHSLDAELYRAAIAEVRAEAGAGMLIQVTSEAAGRYQAAEQVAAIRALRPSAVSVAIREVSGDRLSEREAAMFYGWCRQEAVSIQHVLYSQDDVATLQDYRSRGILDDHAPRVLYVLGRYSAGASQPNDLLPFLAASSRESIWMTCAFGQYERDCLVASALFGGSVRVGFENNRQLPSGDPAKNNEDTVDVVINALAAIGRRPVNGEAAREIMGVISN